LRAVARSRCSGKAITDVELLSLEEDTLDIVVTWNQLAVPNHHETMAGSRPTGA
jgi:hypothetical protein